MGYDDDYFAMGLGRMRSRRSEAVVQTGEDWSKGRAPTGRTDRYRFVDLTATNRTKEDWPYSYSLHYLWGEKQDGYDAVYSDRLSQWDAEKSAAAREAVREYKTIYGHWGREGTEKYLSAYFGYEVECCAVAEGCNVGNGFPYWVFWFRRKRT